MVAPKVLDFLSDLFKELRVDDAGVTVVFYHKEGLVGADLVELAP